MYNQVFESPLGKEDDENLVMEKMEILSRDYSSLMDAMGTDKYRALTFGEGLKSNTVLQDKFAKYSLTDTKYSMGEFTDKNGNFEYSLFVEQNLANTRIIFELELESEKYMRIYDSYRVKHLYIVGKEGKATDLTEELGEECSMYLCPDKNYILGPRYSYIEKKIILPDIHKVYIPVPRTGKYIFDQESTPGIPVVLHEIGHFKHHDADPKVMETHFSGKSRFAKMLGVMGLTREKAEEMIKSGNYKLFTYITDLVKEYAPGIYSDEVIANNYALGWLTKKESEGSTYWKKEDESMWLQLSHALAYYEILYALPEKQ